MGGGLDLYDEKRDLRRFVFLNDLFLGEKVMGRGTVIWLCLIAGREKDNWYESARIAGSTHR